MQDVRYRLTGDARCPCPLRLHYHYRLISASLNNIYETHRIFYCVSNTPVPSSLIALQTHGRNWKFMMSVGVTKRPVIRMAYVLFFTTIKTDFIMTWRNIRILCSVRCSVRLIYKAVLFILSCSHGAWLCAIFLPTSQWLMTNITTLMSCLFRVYTTCIRIEDGFMLFHTHVDRCH